MFFLKNLARKGLKKSVFQFLFRFGQDIVQTINPVQLTKVAMQKDIPCK